jgi:CDP-glucose 4,6-dehydratase
MHTVRDLAEELISVWGKGRILISNKQEEPHKAGVLHLNCDKAYQYLGWYPKWSFMRTVEQTATWYRNVHSGGIARTITRD